MPAPSPGTMNEDDITEVEGDVDNDIPKEDDKAEEPLLLGISGDSSPGDSERSLPVKKDSTNNKDGVDEGDESFEDPNESKQSCISQIKSPGFIIYSSQALSAWGDRMWTFAVGLYLVAIEVDSLRLTAVFGLVIGLSALMCGAIIGNWIDANPRLRVVRLCLLIQNTSVIVCACLLGVLIVFQSEIRGMWGGGLATILQAAIITFGAIANLASIGNKISIQKDWVVVVAGTNKEKLANLNAVIRRIDLAINIVAPIVVGQIMTFVSMLAGAIFIASWNIVSGFVEYYLLLAVYKQVPALAIKKDDTFSDNADEKDGRDCEFEEINLDEEKEKDENRDEGDEETYDKDVESKDEGNKFVEEEKKTKKTPLVRQMFGVVLNLVNGWKVYMSYQVSFAGLGLAFLYMTVLGFDSITNGYAYSQGVQEWLIGVFRGAGSIFGILGTLLFPFLRRKIGLERTGLWAITEQMSCLVLCVACIWVPGSPFLKFDPQVDQNGTMTTVAMPTGAATMHANTTSVLPGSVTSTELAYSALQENVTAPTLSHVVQKVNNNTSDVVSLYKESNSYMSISLFFTGIVCARLGLWMFDLSVTQLLQENVKETQRGVVNGVQSSLNNLMNMLHFVLVIIAPKPETFGFLIMVSFLFVSTGAILYAVYCFKVRGHILPLHHLKTCGKTQQPKDIAKGDVLA